MNNDVYCYIWVYSTQQANTSTFITFSNSICILTQKDHKNFCYIHYFFYNCFHLVNNSNNTRRWVKKTQNMHYKNQIKTVNQWAIFNPEVNVQFLENNKNNFSFNTTKTGLVQWEIQWTKYWTNRDLKKKTIYNHSTKVFMSASDKPDVSYITSKL